MWMPREHHPDCHLFSLPPQNKRALVDQKMAKHMARVGYLPPTEDNKGYALRARLALPSAASRAWGQAGAG